MPKGEGKRRARGSRSTRRSTAQNKKKHTAPRPKQATAPRPRQPKGTPGNHFVKHMAGDVLKGFYATLLDTMKKEDYKSVFYFQTRGERDLTDGGENNSIHAVIGPKDGILNGSSFHDMFAQNAKTEDDRFKYGSIFKKKFLVKYIRHCIMKVAHEMAKHKDTVQVTELPTKPLKSTLMAPLPPPSTEARDKVREDRGLNVLQVYAAALVVWKAALTAAAAAPQPRWNSTHEKQTTAPEEALQKTQPEEALPKRPARNQTHDEMGSSAASAFRPVAAAPAVEVPRMNALYSLYPSSRPRYA